MSGTVSDDCQLGRAIAATVRDVVDAHFRAVFWKAVQPEFDILGACQALTQFRLTEPIWAWKFVARVDPSSRLFATIDKQIRMREETATYSSTAAKRFGLLLAVGLRSRMSLVDMRTVLPDGWRLKLAHASTCEYFSCMLAVWVYHRWTQGSAVCIKSKSRGLLRVSAVRILHGCVRVSEDCDNPMVLVLDDDNHLAFDGGCSSIDILCVREIFPVLQVCYPATAATDTAARSSMPHVWVHLSFSNLEESAWLDPSHGQFYEEAKGASAPRFGFGSCHPMCVSAQPVMVCEIREALSSDCHMNAAVAYDMIHNALTNVPK